MSQSAIAAAGTTKRKRKASNANKSTTGKQGFSYRTYCPFEVSPNPAHPEYATHVTTDKQGKFTCKNGHTWQTVGKVLH